MEKANASQFKINPSSHRDRASRSVAIQDTDIAEKYLRLLSEPLHHDPGHQPSVLNSHKRDVLPWLALKGRRGNARDKHKCGRHGRQNTSPEIRKPEL